MLSSQIVTKNIDFFNKSCDTVYMNFNDSIIRFLSLDLNNMKNVENGTIFVNGFSKKDAWMKYNFETSDVIGIYGQNGSGKTSIIQALVLLRKFVLGDEFFLNTKEFQKYVLYDYITKGKERMSLVARFLVSDKIESKVMEYSMSFVFRKNAGLSINFENPVVLETESFRILNTDLTSTDLYLSYSQDSKQMIEPVSFYNQIIETDADMAVTFQLCKLLSENKCATYLFNPEMQKIYQIPAFNETYHYMKSFRNYISECFCIITKDFMDLASQNLLPLALQNDESTVGSFINFVGVSLRGSQFIEQKRKCIFASLIEELNTVINSIIPDMQLKMITLRSELSSNNQAGDVIEVVSVRNGHEISLRYESDGIKKLLTILNLLVYMHNNQSVFVAIDELDASIFEYLLGEILTMLTESGKGQLVFTSHNLYPLELLEKESIFFTTTNPGHRYIKFKYIKPNNNLRDLYLRTIRLGGQEEPVYSETNTGNMRLSFYSAGKKFEQFLDSM